MFPFLLFISKKVKKNKCKICRRLGIKLFLKGERCFSQKCAMIKRAYPPGPRGVRRTKGVSEYGKELREKQKLKAWYNLEERQFRKYVKEVLGRRRKEEDVTTLLIRVLESRLDNAIFRLGIAPSRSQARQLVSHGHFLVNERRVDIPGYLLGVGDVIRISPKSTKKNIFQDLIPVLKKKQPPSWISFDIDKLEAKVIGLSSVEEAAPPAEVPLIFEFYSK